MLCKSLGIFLQYTHFCSDVLSCVLCPDHLPAQHLPATGGGCAGEGMGEPCGGPEA